ncbi:major facilitator superfamily domain-containing protein [Emericellopsis atlantica]|uniref:Major facilitator superfamily domain-containing protein n=1 Tax=Emericellopsis atlantica TaxID=2614577 RepID=A0A9P8CU24_9HYPO|nr:major facilitator superfamily domain-containing protein [Emericellopsis atlantica]KAG9258882.1 major facilitator superfamily domain-containing protein [Emericellopsis atlantica]
MTRRSDIKQAESALHNQENLLPRRQLLTVFATLSIALLIYVIDQNGIATTLPTIASDLNAKNTISWAGTSALLANTTFQMLYGRLSDIFGRKTVFLTAIALLALADLVCGFSQNATMFYLCRAVAGIGGGGIANLAMIIVSDIVTLEQRGKYQGIIASMIGFGNVIGPFLAAQIASKTTWRAFFWMLAPCGGVTFVLSYVFLPSKPRHVNFQESVRKVDWLGTLTSSLGIIFLLIPISGGGSYFAWDSPMVISMLSIGVLSLVLFVFIEWKVAKLPMMPIEIYANPVVVVMLLQYFIFGAVFQSMIFYIPMYLQNAHEFSMITSALVYIPLPALQAIVSISTGYYITYTKRYGEVLWTGFTLWTLGLGLTLIYTRSTPIGIIIIPFIVIGFGAGCIFQPTLIALQAHSPKARRAVIISNRNFYRCAGGACGLAISAAVMQARLRSALPEQYAYIAHSTYSLPNFSGNVPTEVLDAYMAASHAVFTLQVPLVGICLLGMLFIRDRGLEYKGDRIVAQFVAAGSGENEAVDLSQTTDASDMESGSVHEESKTTRQPTA